MLHAMAGGLSISIATLDLTATFCPSLVQLDLTIDALFFSFSSCKINEMNNDFSFCEGAFGKFGDQRKGMGGDCWSLWKDKEMNAKEKVLR